MCWSLSIDLARSTHSDSAIDPTYSGLDVVIVIIDRSNIHCTTRYMGLAQAHPSYVNYTSHLYRYVMLVIGVPCVIYGTVLYTTVNVNIHGVRLHGAVVLMSLTN